MIGRIVAGLGLVTAMASCCSIPTEIAEEQPTPFTNPLGIKFVYIPPGTFMMGTKNPSPYTDRDEIQHKVTLSKGFYMGVHTVTQEQWQEVMGNNPSFWRAGGPSVVIQLGDGRTETFQNHPVGVKNLPVDSVSWDDCQEFVRRLREKDKKPYRLPTEAEWEYTCRAGTTTAFSFGETITTKQVNFNGQMRDTSRHPVGLWFGTKTAPVGSYPANQWGLHEMHGNVGQWCQDWYADYPGSDVVDPQGPVTGKYRVARGGFYNHSSWNCRSACRSYSDPTHADQGIRICFAQE